MISSSQGNWLSEDACYHLNELLLKNNTLHTLLLTECKIGPKGAAKLCEGISGTVSLKKLDLSGCNIGTEGFDHITTAISYNESIETLLLTNNHLNESCSDILESLLSRAKTLKHLGLSWNSLYTAETWKKLIKGFENNESLTDLDLSWNALSNECVSYLRRLLLLSSPLRKLNLAGNRFSDEDAVAIARGLMRNEILEELYIGNNPLKANGAFILVKAVTPEISSDSSLRVLDLTNVWAKTNILPELRAIRNGRPWLDVKLGGILSNYKLNGPDVQAILLKRANYEAMKPKKKRRRKNFGHFVLSLSDELIPRGRFVELVKNYRLKLSQSLVNELMNAFTSGKHTIDQGLLKSVYMKYYPDTKPPLEKRGTIARAGKKKTKKGKKTKTNKKK